ncbi:MAG: hypothetical protein K6T16_02995 [Candidatus Pacearchaeota archaeon]|nr:hypothetical protein [Candidatus Pacearchaeota archaeon]
MDIIVRPYIFKKLKRKYHPNEKGYICINNLEIAQDWQPWFSDVNALIDSADIIGGIRYVKLQYVLEWKKALNREKDQKDIALIEEYLKKSNQEL